ncbi:MAG: sulfatase-like hydrolase/transferase [Ilumatobacteraceae bacterium]|nr:sulfatase-like hydrolase/transferase [Ilumatobacteraceae bacterium]
MGRDQPAPPNILLITLDQFRADCLSCAGHPVVQTPALDDLASQGIRLTRHYSQAAPCSPGRAALYTGTYQMNNRVVANGTPLDSRLDNVAHAARRAGYTPALFGYTDQGVDPRFVDDPDDPRLSTYEGVLPGFDPVLDMSGWQLPWLQWLNSHGYDFADPITALACENERPVELSTSTFLTNGFLDWLDDQHEPWFAHVSYLRPHPPYSAAGEFATMYDPASCPAPIPIPNPANRHRLFDALLASPIAAAPTDLADVARMQAQYFGMISEVDAQLARIWAVLKEREEWQKTVIVVTADHAEQLGDQGLIQKAGFYESSYAVLGIVRDPLSDYVGVIDDFTENVDIMPTLCEAMGIDVPTQCDGFPLTPFMRGERPSWWRDAAYYEWDWRDVFIAHGKHEWPWDRRLERQNLAVRRSRDRAFVHFGDGSWRCFDLAADPTWQTEVADPEVVLAEAAAMLSWRSRNLDRTMTGMLLQDGGIGRRPAALRASK